MNVLFIGDPHLKINRFDLAKQFLNWLNTLIAEQKPDLVVNLGDTFDTHAVIRSEVMNEFMSHIYKTLSLNIPYVYLVGNHDMYKPNDCTYHAMLPFKGKIKNLYIVDKVIDLFDMTFVPYQHNPNSFPKETLPVCVAHQTFIGADYGPMVAKEGVDPYSIKGADIIVSGHIHTRSLLGPVRYVGSPFSQSASDIDQIKGISVINTSSYKEIFFESPFPVWKKLRVAISGDFSSNDVQSTIASSLRTFPRDHWVIELVGPKAEIVSLLSSKEYKEIVNGIDVKIKTSFTDKEKKKISIEAKSMEHIMSEFINKVYNGSLDKTALLNAAKDVLSESRNSQQES